MRVTSLRVHLLGPRRINIVRAQAGFDMRDRDSVIECRKSRRESRGGVALHNDPIGPKRSENPAYPRQCGAGYVGQILIGPHQFKIPIRPQFE